MGRITSFRIDDEVEQNQEFIDASRKRGFLKKFLNDSLRARFIKKEE